MTISRRRLLNSAALIAATPIFKATTGLPIFGQARAEQAGDWKHAVSLFDDVKYPAGFERFDYVNATAPKGGMARQISIGTFDNFNIAVAGVKGSLAPAVGLIYETLMVQSLDEASTKYGLLAEAVSFPPDFSSVTYRLRKQARWHDGKPVTSDDVIFSFESLKKYSPMYASYYSHVVKAEKAGAGEIKFTFDGAGNRELPAIVGELTVLPKHWWDGSDADGKKRDIGATTLEKPLGSGPYAVKEFVAGRSVSLERVKDYWGAKLPVRIGSNNFDEMRFEFFRDTTVALEAFKGDQADWIAESSAKNWETAYDFPAVIEKRVVKEEFPINDSGRMQAFAFNIRRDLFKDKRVRRAFNYAFDFEEMNKQLFYGKYRRINSYFDGTVLASKGIPVGKEEEILKSVYDDMPPEVLTKPYENPVGGDPDKVRENLRQALRLLKEAGFEVRDQQMVDKDGKQIAVEFLVQDPSAERIALFYKPSLERLGIAISIRNVDSAQYENRLRNFDFDIITDVWGESLSPGNEQREFWGSAAADIPGSRNTIGIKNPVIDKLIDKVIFAEDRATLVAATKALDRVLLWHYYVVPQFTYGFARYARWDRFSHADLPQFARAGLPALWWFDKDKADKIGRRS